MCVCVHVMNPPDNSPRSVSLSLPVCACLCACMCVCVHRITRIHPQERDRETESERVGGSVSEWGWVGEREGG